MPRVGLEPTHGCPYQILSLARLPVSPPRQKAVILAKFSLILAYLLELFLDFKKNILLAEARIKAQKERDKLTNININEVNSTFKECFLKYCEHKKMH